MFLGQVIKQEKHWEHFILIWTHSLKNYVHPINSELSSSVVTGGRAYFRAGIEIKTFNIGIAWQSELLRFLMYLRKYMIITLLEKHQFHKPLFQLFHYFKCSWKKDASSYWLSTPMIISEECRSRLRIDETDQMKKLFSFSYQVWEEGFIFSHLKLNECKAGSC